MRSFSFSCAAMFIFALTANAELYWDFQSPVLPNWNTGTFRVRDGILANFVPSEVDTYPGSFKTSTFRYSPSGSGGESNDTDLSGSGSGDESMTISINSFDCHSGTGDNCTIELLRVDQNNDIIDAIWEGVHFGSFTATLQYPVIEADGYYALRVTAYDFDNPTVKASLDDLRITNAVSATWIQVPGDTNHNGVADASDYVIWRKNLFEVVEPYYDGDANGNGFVNDADYDYWKRYFGSSASGSGSSQLSSSLTAPEPCAFGLIACCFPIILLTTARRRAIKQ